MSKYAITAALLVTLSSQPVSAALVFPDFTNTAGLSLVGNAATVGPVLRLNGSAQNAAGATWSQAKQPVAGGFDTTFQFRISNRGGATHPAGYNGGDGIAFLVQNQGNNAIGPDANLSYSNITSSIAIELDTWANIGGVSGMNLGDPNVENHVSIHTRGLLGNSFNESASIGMTTNVPQIKDGLVHSARILYVPGLMSVYIDDLSNPILSVAVDLTNIGGSSILDGSGQAFVGFTAGTGGSFETHDILSWNYIPEPTTGLLVAVAASVIARRRKSIDR